jgi:hypothetical protein
MTDPTTPPCTPTLEFENLNSSDVLNTRLLPNAPVRKVALILDIANDGSSSLIKIPDLGDAEPIEFLLAESVEVDGEGPRDEEPSERHSHGLVVGAVVGGETSERGEERTAAHGGDDPAGAALGVAAEATDGEREDGGEDAGLEEEDEGEHGDSSFALDAHGGADEDHDRGHEDHEDDAGLDDHEEAGGGESTDGEEGLANGVAVGGSGGGDLSGLLRVLDELRGDGNLGADVAELGGDTEEELVLRAEGPVFVTGEVRALLGLEGHVGVSDLGDGREEEDDGEAEDEGRDAEVGPLDGGEGVVVDVLEEDARGEEGRNDGAYGLEGLREFETELRESGGTAGGDEGVSGGLEGGESGSNNEEGAAEAGE